MRVLLITESNEDYLADSIIHGFKQQLGINAAEYPIKASLYKDFVGMNSIRGGGFTLYGLLDTELKPRFKFNTLEEEIVKGEYDLVILTMIFKQSALYLQLFPILYKIKNRVICLDGDDVPNVFPFVSIYLSKLRFLFAPKPHKYFSYFKRELTEASFGSIFFNMLKYSVIKRFQNEINIYPISFSIPKVKIVTTIPKKTKLFTKHVVDEEVANKIAGSYISYAFLSEEEYYTDIQNSKFGITTKRAGWDCLRHYEIAANGAVICFRDLDKKPRSCAPHGLLPGFNCISYSSYNDLIKQIDKLTDEQYLHILENTMMWVELQTTTTKSQELMLKFKTIS